MDQRLLQKLLAEAQKNKKIMDSKIAELQNTVFKTEIGKGLIEMSANGKYEIISCNFSDEAMKDKETLQDLVISAFNDLVSQINSQIKKTEEQLMPKKFF